MDFVQNTPFRSLSIFSPIVYFLCVFSCLGDARRGKESVVNQMNRPEKQSAFNQQQRPVDVASIRPSKQYQHQPVNTSPRPTSAAAYSPPVASNRAAQVTQQYQPTKQSHNYSKFGQRNDWLSRSHRAPLFEQITTRFSKDRTARTSTATGTVMETTTMTTSE